MRKAVPVLAAFLAWAFAEGGAHGCSQAVVLIDALMGFEADESSWRLHGRVDRDDDGSLEYELKAEHRDPAGALLSALDVPTLQWPRRTSVVPWWMWVTESRECVPLPPEQDSCEESPGLPADAELVERARRELKLDLLSATGESPKGVKSKLRVFKPELPCLPVALELEIRGSKGAQRVARESRPYLFDLSAAVRWSPSGKMVVISAVEWPEGIHEDRYSSTFVVPVRAECLEGAAEGCLEDVKTSSTKAGIEACAACGGPCDPRHGAFACAFGGKCVPSPDAKGHRCCEGEGGEACCP